MEEQTYEPTNAQILARLDGLQCLVEALAAHAGVDLLLARVTPADDQELNSEWGNPQLDRTPKNWTGEPIEGRYMNDLHPATLRALARHYLSLADWHDKKGNVDNKGRPRSTWARKDASRALGWALRLERQGQRGPGARRPQHREEHHPAPPAAPSRRAPDGPGEVPANSPEDLDHQGSDDVPF